MASVLSEYLKETNGVPVMTKNALNQLVKEQFPHCKKASTKLHQNHSWSLVLTSNKYFQGKIDFLGETEK
ncbi:UNVERIFIED_CONTAM: hypothetical protein K2H54_022848 [Gekko kuhli]